MPDITLSIKPADMPRIRAWLATTPYPQTPEGLRQVLFDLIAEHVTEIERAADIASARATVPARAKLKLD